MRTGLLVDSTCDLPEACFQDGLMRVLPISIRLGKAVLVDTRSQQATLHFYAEQLAEHGIEAESIPFSANQIEELFLSQLVREYDFVFCITVGGRHSPIADNAQAASFGILSQCRKVRTDAGLTGPFAMRVIDSGTIFAGTGLLAAEASRLIRAGIGPSQIRGQLETLAPKICVYMVPENLGYVRDRGFRKGERKSMADRMKAGLLTVGSALSMHPIIRMHGDDDGPAANGFSYRKSVEKMLGHVAEQIRTGNLLTQQVCLSYAGDPSRIPEMPGYAGLKAAAELHNVELHSSMMSATGAINVGGGCLSIAYAGEVKPL
jgi:DegV family protein with EDD domain